LPTGAQLWPIKTRAEGHWLSLFAAGLLDNCLEAGRFFAHRKGMAALPTHAVEMDCTRRFPLL